jgi:hypothetical protein
MPSFFEIDYNNVKSIFSTYTNYTRLTEKIYHDIHPNNYRKLLLHGLETLNKYPKIGRVRKLILDCVFP